MIDFIKYILGEVKNGRLAKKDAIELIRQHNAQSTNEEACTLNPLSHQNSGDTLKNSFVSAFTDEEPFVRNDDDSSNEHEMPFVDDKALLEASVEHIKKLICEVTQIPMDKLDSDLNFAELGFDSIIISSMNKKIEEWVGKLDPTLFYKYSSIIDLGAYIAKEYRVLISKALIKDSKLESKSVPLNEKKPVIVSFDTAKNSHRPKTLIDENINDIAIIGVSGRYPQAPTLNEFWKNLCEGKDCISEIPESRWSLDEFFEPDRAKAVLKGLSYSKWGGFLDNIDCFDTLFFNISPKDAAFMDPQERIFLETAWECIEDAGYTRKLFTQQDNFNKVGVFVGATFNNYQLYMAEAAMKANQNFYSANSQMYSIANRVSYLMNFTGPSMTIDTACSSSLYAIHLACESIKSGQSRMAIAGGVNLTIHPSKYIVISQSQFNASDGRCRAFCEGGTGYVPSEGVGAVLLKPLQDAIKDKDIIYGVVKGTAANHGGRTNGYTIPNPSAQSDVIEKALLQSKINPRSISFVEAHGTGTALGDPIEITGLTDVYRKYTDENGFCAISSVKANIGHTESAAGIAQVTKVLLQMKYKTLVKNVMHGNGLNPNIDFAQTPFVVQKNTEPWKRPVIDRQEVPRRAGISSFGAGGANAHVIIEEYFEEKQDNTAIVINSSHPAIILLSAKNENRLKEKAKQLLAYVNEQQASDSDVASIAYTLQVGREAMEERLALTVGSINELCSKLNEFIAGNNDITDLYKGKVKRSKENVFSQNDISKENDKLLNERDYSKVSELWVKGIAFDWNKLYGNVKPLRISLPVYPFEKEAHWIPEPEVKAAQNSKAGCGSAKEAAFIHPLLHQNTSDLSEQRFSSCFTGNEFFLKDHVVNSSKVLPGVAYIEMARAAVECSTAASNGTIRIKNMVWARPITAVSEQTKVNIGLFPETNGDIGFEIYTINETDAEPVIHSQGCADFIDAEKPEALDIKTLKESCGKMFSSAQCYEAFNSAGMDYGPGQRALYQIYVGKGIILAKLLIPSSFENTLNQFVLHPAMMDSALQAAIGLALEDNAGKMKTYLPFALQQIEIFGRTAPEMWAFIRYSNGSNAEDKVQKLDIDLCDSTGNICVTMKGFSSRVLTDGTNSGKATTVSGLSISSCELKNSLLKKIADLLNAGIDDLEPDTQLSEYGFDQFTLAALIESINNEYSLELQQSELLGCDTLNSIIEYLTSKHMNIASSQVENPEPVQNVKQNKEAFVESGELLKERTINYLKKLLSSVLMLPMDKIESDTAFEEYGIDSISSMQLVNNLEEEFGTLPKTLFFEYQNIGELAEYFIEAYNEELTRLLGIEKKAEVKETISSNTEDLKEFNDLPKKSRIHSRFVFNKNGNGEEKINSDMDIAIVGVSGRYPMAEDLEAFWENLKEGKDCITEIPKERWDYNIYFDKNKNIDGKSYSKWGGFLDGADQFDPLFFNISPREAETMDPQERLFLQCVYSAIEDAAYTKDTLGFQGDSGRYGNVGVFVGVIYEDYQLYGAQETIMGRPIALPGSIGSIANRVSYFCNFHGPSIAVDTMCSSSLTSIHLACQSLQKGECRAAVAGGVNLTIHPNKYILLSQGKFMSSKGRCEAFGKGGDGYVPGEGVGAVVLKPLSRAVADNDNIYGVIKATAVNHGGKTNGYTVPNLNAQAEVIGRAYREAGINPRAVSYIEAHGTGTSLGDPIEIAGLNKAFGEYTKDKQFCSIGSVKSNIGHCEGAAGIAGVTKILLQIKHKQLVPSIHSNVLNPYIDFNNSPFAVQQELTGWERPSVDTDGTKVQYPRIAGISSFGAGGSNAHIIIEEYIPANAEKNYDTAVSMSPAIIILSAKNSQRLIEQAKRLLNAVSRESVDDSCLSDIAYTLQVGREAMEERIAMTAGSINELKEKLYGFINGQNGIDEFYRGHVSHRMNLAESDEDMLNTVNAWISKGKYTKLLDMWVNGFNIDWSKMYGSIKPRRISLPAYPFERERYWVPGFDDKKSGYFPMASTMKASLHPMLHQNTSDLVEQRFTSTFNGNEFFLNHHVVNGNKILPGVAYLEMARAALEQAAGAFAEKNTIIKLKDIVWLKPAVVNDSGLKVSIGLFEEQNGSISFEIYGDQEESSAEPVIFSQGCAVFETAAKPVPLDIEVIRNECQRKILSSAQCYDIFSNVGLDYGPGHQGIETLYIGEEQVLARLSLPAEVSDTIWEYVLHPSLMDSALQAAVGLSANSGKPELSLPFALEAVEILGSCVPQMWAVIRYSEDSKPEDKVKKFDIDICDDAGNVAVSMKRYSTRITEVKTNQLKASSVLMMQPIWKEKAIDSNISPLTYEEHVVILCETATFYQHIETQLEKVRFINLQTEECSIEKRYQDYALQIFEEIKRILKGRQRGKVLFQVIISGKDQNVLYSGFSGLIKTARKENPNFIGQLIALYPDNALNIADVISENGRNSIDINIRYKEEVRYVEGLQEIKVQSRSDEIPWKDNGIYMITGGTGKLGMIFAKEIAGKVNNSTIILTGRNALDENRKGKLSELEALGCRTEYIQTDICDREKACDLIQGIVKNFGALNGIIHSAGMINDSFIIKKPSEQFAEVLLPKVQGLVNLDEASKDIAMDFVILFSSTAGSFGNPGQADYCAANSFMDAYAVYRNGLVLSNMRKGATLSVNWPLWKDGGMHVDDKTNEIFMQNGISPLNTSNGIKALYDSMASGKSNVIVIEGNIEQIRQGLNPETVEPEAVQEIGKSVTVERADINEVPLENNDNSRRDKAADYLKTQISSVIKLPADKIGTTTPMENYGIDSIVAMDLVSKLEKTFGSLSKTLFFEYQNISELTGYFIENHSEQLNKLLGTNSKEKQTPEKASKQGVPERTSVKAAGRSRRSRLRYNVSTQAEEKTKALDIAIIGVAGRYPQALNLDKYWENLKAGRDCITEIPKDRWDHSIYFDSDKNKLGKSYSKWGGFIEGVGEFDPLFFNISPIEAEIMEPQERLFLQCVYSAIEDSGYTRDTIKASTGTYGNVGVFVGVMYEEYQLYGAQETAMGRPIALSSSIASIANRVSYFCNFHGPSIALDTMCSSSLTSLHLACQSLQKGECRMAVAGGVNISIHPNKYLLLSQSKFTSSKGRCESFGEGGDGYVPGEGVGAVILKPLSEAIADNDNIYGVVKATALNHGGKTNGYTVPNPNAQAEVLGHAFSEAGINPRTISYIEAHGTGTSLGDPIEISGLNKAFGEYTKDKQFCAIGSAKSNIGHCESAAGIAAITKVLLQLKYKQLVPSIHSKILNPYIDFENSPFRVQQELAPWDRPIVNIDGKPVEYPRIAGISSFGAGGSNAHVLIEEYIPSNGRDSDAVKISGPAIIVLSAKNEERLNEQAQQLLDEVCTKQLDDSSLYNMAYTLQTGREAMEERMAVPVSSIAELKEKLTSFIEAQDNIPGLHRGQSKSHRGVMSIFDDDEDMESTVNTWIAKGKYNKVMELWVSGFDVDWAKMYGGAKLKKISLPTYPFAREHCWFSHPENTGAAGNITPLLQRINPKDTARLKEGIVFETVLSPEHSSVAEYQVSGEHAFPLSGCIEMVIEAIREIEGDVKVEIHRIESFNRLILNEKVSVKLAVEISDDSRFNFMLMNSENEQLLYCSGEAGIVNASEDMYIDCEALRERCSFAADIEELYENCSGAGTSYSGAFRNLKEIYSSNNEVFGLLDIDKLDRNNAYNLHPGLLESAFGTSIALLSGNNEIDEVFLIKGIKLYGSIPSKVYSYMRKSGDGKCYQLVLLDAEGKVLAWFEEISVRKTENVKDRLMYVPIWEEQALQSHINQTVNAPVLIVYRESCYRFEEPLDSFLRLNKGIENIHRIQLGSETANLGEGRWICDIDDNESLGKCVEECGAAGTVFFISQFEEEQDSNMLRQSQKNNEIQLLRLSKQLKKQQTENVDLHVLTIDKFNNEASSTNPYGAGVTGLAYSIAQGEHMFSVRNLDVSSKDLQTQKGKEKLIKLILSEKPTNRGEVIRLEDGRRYKQAFIELSQVVPSESGFKQGGVYVILGGSGTVGTVITRHLMKKFNAKVVWIGRKPQNSKEIANKIDALRSFGQPPIYISADATNAGAMLDAAERIKKIHPVINGAIFSGLVFDSENSVAETSESQFEDILNIKTLGSINFYNAFKNEQLDFMCYFSSAQAFSFSGAVNFSAYAAGITFSDAFVRSVSKNSTFPVGIINWGFWKATVGEAFTGNNIGLLGDNEGSECLEYFAGLLINRSLKQVLCLRTSDAVKQLMNCKNGETVFVGDSGSNSLAEDLWNHSKGDIQQIDTLLDESKAWMDELDGWMSRLLFLQMRKLPVFNRSENKESADIAYKMEGIVPKYVRLIDECLRILHDKGYIRINGSDINILNSSDLLHEEEILNEWETVKEMWMNDTKRKAQVRLLDACIKKLPEILKGDMLATDVLFPDSSMEMVEGIYKENAFSDHFNNAVADGAEEYVRKTLESDANAKVRIIEIGAGTGGTSSFVFSRLKQYAANIEYCYTDISKSFLMFAEEKYGPDNPYLVYKLWDMDKPLAAQEIEMGQYDLAIATNVIHATKNIRRTLRNAKAALKTNGILLINELVMKSIFTTLTFGLLEGWWLYEDDSLRITGSPILDKETWIRVLEEEGFRKIYFPEQAILKSGQQIISAQSDGIVRQVNKAAAVTSKNDIGTIKKDKKLEKHDGSKLNSGKKAAGDKPKNQRKAPVSIRTYVEDVIFEQLAKSLKVSRNSIDSDAAFSDFGVDSIIGVSFVKHLSDAFGVLINTAVLFDYTTVKRLTDYIVKTYKEQLQNKINLHEDTDEHVQRKIESLDALFTDNTEPVGQSENIANNKVKDNESVEDLGKQFLSDQISAEFLIDSILGELGSEKNNG